MCTRWTSNVTVAGQQDTVLVSSLAASPAAYELPILATAAQSIWYSTAPWQDRQADLRDSALLAPGDLGGFTPGFWIKAVGDWTSRDDKIDPPAGFLFNLDYTQDTYGVVAGVDGAGHVGSGTGLIGIAAGYLNSTLHFNGFDTFNPTYEGWTASVYATYLQDQWFLDGQIKGDFLTLKASSMGGSASTSVNTWGGQVEGGYRWPVGTGTLEPVGTLAFTSTNIGNQNLGGTTANWGNEDSFRGAIGLRYFGAGRDQRHVHGETRHRRSGLG